jgi:plastocyanin
MTEMRRRRHRLWLATLLGVVAVLSFTGFSSAANQTIEASGLSWSPSTATVTTADTLTIKNPSSMTLHSVSWDGGPTTPNCTGVPGTGQTNWTGTCTFSQAGSYSFFCTVHGQSMSADVTVNSAGPGAPIVSTSAATLITDTGATLEGSVNPNGLATEYFFKYGTTAAYGQETGVTSVPAGTSPVSASTGVTGLTAATTYHFKLFAENSSGTKEGSDLTFTTKGPPLATTSAATPVTDVNATLRGSVNPRGHATTYFFKWGETASYGHETSVASAGSGISSTLVSAPLTGLLPETTYHFRLVANNSSGPAEGTDLSFTTTSTPPPPPPPPPDPLPTPITPVITPPPPVTPPDTKITLKPAAKTKDRTPTFKFKSTVAGATFKCTLDAKALKPCRSPLTTKTLSFGRHTLKVRAVVGGASDPTPAAYSFKVLKP